METHNEVIILRGISGAGKTTYAERRFRGQETKICSADHFFMKDGRYVFDWRLLKRAHKACLREFLDACFRGFSGRIIVDNTNIEMVHILPYVSIAEVFDRPVRIITLEADPEAAAKRHVHGVLIHTVHKQLANLMEEEKRFPKDWNHQKVKD